MTLAAPVLHLPVSHLPVLHLPCPAPAPHAALDPLILALKDQGAQLAAAATERSPAPDRLHVVLCLPDDSAARSDDVFFQAIAKAHALVAAGARRIVFLTPGSPAAGARLRASLRSFCENASRVLSRRPVAFDCVAIEARDPALGALQAMGRLQATARA